MIYNVTQKKNLNALNIQMTSTTDNGSKMLYFEAAAPLNLLDVIEYEDYVYIADELNMDDEGIFKVYAHPYYGSLKGMTIDVISGLYNLETIVKELLSGTGWSASFEDDIPGIYNIKIQSQIVLNALTMVFDTWNVEYYFDTKAKVIKIGKHLGEVKDIIVVDKNNFINCKMNSDAYQLVTRLYPLGANGITVGAVNGGRPFVEDYSYTQDVIVGYYTNPSINNPFDLLSIAKEKVREMAQPHLTYTINLMQLNNYVSPRDRIRIIDHIRNINTTLEVVKKVYYPYYNDKSYIECGAARRDITKELQKMSSAQQILNNQIIRNLTELNHQYE